MRKKRIKSKKDLQDYITDELEKIRIKYNKIDDEMLEYICEVSFNIPLPNELLGIKTHHEFACKLTVNTSVITKEYSAMCVLLIDGISHIEKHPYDVLQNFLKKNNIKQYGN